MSKSDPKTHTILPESMILDLKDLVGETVKQYYECCTAPNTSDDEVFLMESGKVLAFRGKGHWNEDSGYISINSSIQKDIAVELGFYDKEDLDAEVAEYEQFLIEEKIAIKKADKYSLKLDLQRDPELLEYIKENFDLIEKVRDEK